MLTTPAWLSRLIGTVAGLPPWARLAAAAAAAFGLGAVLL